jgi:hypothetical protein
MPSKRRRKQGGTLAALGQAISQVAVPGLLWYGLKAQRSRMARKHTSRTSRKSTRRTHRIPY